MCYYDFQKEKNNSQIDEPLTALFTLDATVTHNTVNKYCFALVTVLKNNITQASTHWVGDGGYDKGSKRRISQTLNTAM